MFKGVYVNLMCVCMCLFVCVWVWMCVWNLQHARQDCMVQIVLIGVSVSTVRHVTMSLECVYVLLAGGGRSVGDVSTI